MGELTCRCRAVSSWRSSRALAQQCTPVPNEVELSRYQEERMTKGLTIIVSVCNVLVCTDKEERQGTHFVRGQGQHSYIEIKSYKFRSPIQPPTEIDLKLPLNMHMSSVLGLWVLNVKILKPLSNGSGFTSEFQELVARYCATWSDLGIP
uniref:Uncharacterized protein n=1 Tax=Oryza glumipatula TaxID=40148 RepID=A0A0E0BIR1_9ORYZ